MDANPDAAIAAWLRASRRSQVMDDGVGGTKPWTVKHFLSLLETEEHWAPAHSNYSNYELGKQVPTPRTLKRFTDFWARRHVDGPDLTPREPEPTESETLLSALIAHTAEMRAQTAAQVASTAVAAALVSRIDQLLPSDRIREMLAWAEEHMPTSPSPGPTPDPAGSRARS